MRRLAIAAAMVCALTGALVPANAYRLPSAYVALAVPLSSSQGYGTPDITIRPQGPAQIATLTFANYDPALHNIEAVVTSSRRRPDSTAPWCYGHGATSRYPRNLCPIFWSPDIDFKETTPVLGLNDGEVKTGVGYEFFCGLHADVMRGTLTVSAT